MSADPSSSAIRKAVEEMLNCGRSLDQFAESAKALWELAHSCGRDVEIAKEYWIQGPMRREKIPQERLFQAKAIVLALEANMALDAFLDVSRALCDEIVKERKAKELEKANNQNGDGVSSRALGSAQGPRAHIVSLRPARNPRGGRGGTPKDETKQLEFELKSLQSPERTPEQLAEAEARAKEQKEAFHAAGSHCEITPEELAARAAAAKQRKKEEYLAKIRAEVGPRKRKR